MTDGEKEQVKEMYQYYCYRCFVSGKAASNRAHIIGDTKSNIKTYGNEIVGNPLNWLPAHNLYYNGLIDVGKNYRACEYIANTIKSDLPIEFKRRKIEEFVKQNIKRKLNKK